MGRLNLSKIKYLYNQILYKGLKKIPYKYKKPLILGSSLLGLLVYFQIMLKFTESSYLYMVIDAINYIKNYFSTVDQKLVFIAFALILVILIKRYLLTPSDDNSKYPSKSIYREINTVISFCYLGITILGVLPLLGL